MADLRDDYAEKRTSEFISVHKNLISRALPMLYQHVPEAEKVFAPHVDTMIENVCNPDNKGDYENGTGRHYYCSSGALGLHLKTVGGYYKNGLFRFSKSARTMLEEDYTMALTSWHAGFIEEAVVYFSRALHMIEDMCCLPHATRMTYISIRHDVHHIYESLAKWMYPDSVPEQAMTERELHLFDKRDSFGPIVNQIVEDVTAEREFTVRDPEKALFQRLYITEKVVAAFFFRFYNDLSKSPEEAHYLIDGMKFDLFRSKSPVTVKVTENGIQFTHNKRPIACYFGTKTKYNLFRAAHRHDGIFTFSPVGEPNGDIIVPRENKLRTFHPLNESLYIEPLTENKEN